MNQILVTEKLYITPELKRKKKLYKASFILSIFAVIALASFYVYAEYDKARSEDISKDILSELTVQAENRLEEEKESEEDNVWRIIISSVDNANEQNQQQITENNQEQETNNVLTNQQTQNSDEETVVSAVYTTVKGKKYKTVGSVNIPKINVNYPILAETTVELLKVSPCKFYGPEPNEVGNLCIAGHNYKNNQFFSKVPQLVKGDVIEITDLSGKTTKYSVFDKYTVIPEDTSCTSQNTKGKKLVTLITCTDDNKKRVIVHAKEII